MEQTLASQQAGQQGPATPCALSQQQQQQQQQPEGQREERQQPKRKKKFKHVSFNASGIMSVYHFGVAACLNQFADMSDTHYYGASAGALVGASALVGLSPYASADSMITHCEAVAQDSARIGPLLAETLDALCPDDAHEKCSHRLHISCSKWDFTRLGPAYFSTFDTLRQFKDTLLASAHLPFISGVMPQNIEGYEGQYLDGVLTDPHPAPERVSAAREEEPTPAQTPVPATPDSNLTKGEHRAAFTYPLVSRIRELTVVESSSDADAESDDADSTVAASTNGDAATQNDGLGEEAGEVCEMGLRESGEVVTATQHHSASTQAQEPTPSHTAAAIATMALLRKDPPSAVGAVAMGNKEEGEEGTEVIMDEALKSPRHPRAVEEESQGIVEKQEEEEEQGKKKKQDEEADEDDEEDADEEEEEEQEQEQEQEHEEKEGKEEKEEGHDNSNDTNNTNSDDDNDEDERHRHATPPVYDDETLLVAWSPTCSCGCAKNGDPRVLTSTADLHYMWCARPPPLPFCRLIFYLGYWNAYCMLHPEEAEEAKRLQPPTTTTAATDEQKESDLASNSSSTTSSNSTSNSNSADGTDQAKKEDADTGSRGTKEGQAAQGEREELLQMLMATPLAGMEAMGPELPAILKKVWPQVESTIQAEHDTFRQMWERHEVWNIAYIWIQARRAELTALGVLSSTVLLSGLAYTLDVSASMGALDALEYMSTSLRSFDLSAFDAVELMNSMQQQGLERLDGFDVENIFGTAVTTATASGSDGGRAAFSVLESFLDSLREAIFT